MKWAADNATSGFSVERAFMYASTNSFVSLKNDAKLPLTFLSGKTISKQIKYQDNSTKS